MEQHLTGGWAGNLCPELQDDCVLSVLKIVRSASSYLTWAQLLGTVTRYSALGQISARFPSMSYVGALQAASAFSDSIYRFAYVMHNALAVTGGSSLLGEDRSDGQGCV